MFNPEFYITPKEVIAKMLEPYFIPEPGEGSGDKEYRKYRYQREYNRLNSMAILDPAAGSGALLKYIQEEFCWRSKNKKMYCIEPEPELQHILRGEGFRLIGNDFLSYSGDYYFDLIIMNPPFSIGDQMLLKAWEIMKEGEIICILNAETIRNACTERRQLLRKIIKDNDGKVEFIGPAFAKAERPTNVDCCIVRLTKKAQADKLNFEFKNITTEKDTVLSESILNNPIATRDVIGNMIKQYELCKEYYVKYLEAMEGLSFYSKPLVNSYFKLSDVLDKNHSGDKRHDFNNFCDIMKGQIWNEVIKHLNIQKFMTHNVRQNFKQFCDHQGALDFTKENVAELVQMIFENRYNILDKAIMEVFDVFTKYYKDNRCYVEGWKTNDKWKVNRKIILPNWISMSWEKPADRIRWGSEYQINYSRSSEYSDIDKALCYITGKDFDQCLTISDALQNKFKQIGKVYKGPHKAECESEFFYIKFFMKGTVHLEFKDEKLWQEFNLRACAGKNWLPENEMKDYQQRNKPADKRQPVNEAMLLDY